MLGTTALNVLARAAGEGEVRAAAVRSLERSRAAIELEGWLLLQELRLADGVLVRHGLVGPGGIVVAVPCGPVARYHDLVEADQQAGALADLVGLQRRDVTAVVATLESDEPPSEQFLGGCSAIVIGDRRLPDWLSQMQPAIAAEALDQLRIEIVDQAERLSSANPTRLPDEPMYG